MSCIIPATELQEWIDSNQAAYNTAFADWTTADSQISSQGPAFDRIKEQTYKPDINDFYQFTNAAEITQAADTTFTITEWCVDPGYYQEVQVILNESGTTLGTPTTPVP